MQQADVQLVQVLRETSLHRIEDVLRVMDEIDRLLPHDDGIRWFNFLYRLVTQEVQQHCERNTWKNTRWIVCLDVEFAKLFFQAVEQWLREPYHTPRAWVPLFTKRFDHRLSPLQFGLAGLNAHINRDLPLAIVTALEQTTQQPPRSSPHEAEDFQHINALLDRVELHALEQMATGWIKRASDTFDPLDKRAAMSLITLARRKAWEQADELWALSQAQSPQIKTVIEKLDRRTEIIGRGLLLPTYSR